MKNQNNKNSKGYTLLFAVLVSSLTLAIGISILNISKKEFLLSSSARESSTSFYVADSGLECAAFADYSGALATSTISTFTCNNNSITPIYTTENIYSPYTITFNANFSGNTCASVKVVKQYVYDPDGLPGNKDMFQTSIESRGYNLGWRSNTKDCLGVSAKKTERALRLTY